MSKRTYHGSCHCRAVEFEVDLDLMANGTTKCNCTVCWKRRWWGTIVKPDAFRLLKAPEEYSYGFPTESMGTRVLCKKCGITTFGWGHLEQIGGDYVSISVSSLDDLDPADLVAAPVKYFNGLENKWWEEPAEKRHL
jgi:hypothetical protein